MVFICPPKEDSKRRSEVLGRLKGIVDKLAEQEAPVPVQMCPPPMMCCQHGNHPCCGMPQSNIPNVQMEKQICLEPPDMMVLYKVKKPAPKAADANKKGNGNKGKKDDDAQVKQSKSRELRGGILYSGCDCEKRNGLQDDCQRSECRGSPACLTKPNPTCGPSQFSNGKHLGKKSYKTSQEEEGKGDGGAGGSSPATTKHEYMCFPAVLDTSNCCPC